MHENIIRLNGRKFFVVVVVSGLVNTVSMDIVIKTFILNDENGVMESMKFVPEKKQEEKQSD